MQKKISKYKCYRFRVAIYRKGGLLLLDENILLKKALESFPNFVIIDNTGKIIYMNENYAQFLGINQKDALGAHVKDIIPNTQMMRILKNGTPEIGSIMNFYDYNLKKDVTIVCNRFPLKDEDSVIGAMAMTTMSDLSEFENLKEEFEKIKDENEKIKNELVQYKENWYPLSKVIGNSSAMKKLKKAIEEYAQSNFPILITGETGVGKEIFANAIQQLSNRAINNYVKINCASIPKELIESELFGYDEGAFSGAKKGGKMGLFELANNGTILLDEIGEMPLILQSKLLRVLQEKSMKRVGGLNSIELNIRVICCTNSDLKKMLEEGKFREDLYYRINMVELNIPPLRDHKEDIPALCEYFIKKVNEEEFTKIEKVSPEILKLFYDYSWKGNVRELEHTIERAAFICKKGIIEISHCNFFAEKLEKEKNSDKTKHDSKLLKGITDTSEKNAIVDAIEQSDGNKTKAALLLGINRSLLYSKMKKYGLK